MQITSINGLQNPSFNAALKVTPAAKNIIYKSEGVFNTVICNRIFERSMDKFERKLCGEFPFAGYVFFDAISKNTKELHPGTNAKYEMRLYDKTVDFDFNHSHFSYDDKCKSHKDFFNKIEQESDIQSGYLYSAYLHLKKLCGR